MRSGNDTPNRELHECEHKDTDGAITPLRNVATQVYLPTPPPEERINEHVSQPSATPPSQEAAERQFTPAFDALGEELEMVIRRLDDQEADKKEPQQIEQHEGSGSFHDEAHQTNVLSDELDRRSRESGDIAVSDFTVDADQVMIPDSLITDDDCSFSIGRIRMFPESLKKMQKAVVEMSPIQQRSPAVTEEDGDILSIASPTRLGANDLPRGVTLAASSNDAEVTPPSPSHRGVAGRMNRFDFDSLFPTAVDIETYSSTNASDGIRPYCPNRGQPCGNSFDGQESSSRCDSPHPSTTRRRHRLPPIGNCPVSRGRFHAAVAWMKITQLFRACRSFIPFGLILAPLYVNAILLLFKYAPLRMCTFQCACSLYESLAFMFSYHIATTMPRCVLFVMLLRTLIPEMPLCSSALPTVGGRGGEKGAAIDGGGGAAVAGVRVVVGIGASEELNRSSSPLQNRGRSGSASSDDQQHRSPKTPAVFSWDIGSLTNVMRQPSALALAFTIFSLQSIVVIVLGRYIPEVVFEFAQILALCVPLMAYAHYRQKLVAAIPVALIEAMPFMFQMISEAAHNNKFVSHAFVIGWPTIIMMIDRFVYFLTYVCVCSSSSQMASSVPASSVPSSPLCRGVPVAAKVCLSVIITAFSQVLIMCVTLSVDVSQSPATVGIVAVQVFIYEMLFGTLLLERLGCHLWNKVHGWIAEPKSQSIATSPIEPCDFRCIGTQTRWCSSLIAIVAVVPLIAGDLLPVKVTGSDCEGRRVGFTLFWSTFGVLLAAIVIAAVLTGYIRWRNDCLRPPVLIRSRGISFCLCAYLLMLVPYGVPFFAVDSESILPGHN